MTDEQKDVDVQSDVLAVLEDARKEAWAFGAAYVRINSDGSAELLDPSKVVLKSSRRPRAVQSKKDREAPKEP